MPSLHRNAQLIRHSKQSGNVKIYLVPFLSTITGSQKYWPLQLITLSITHNTTWSTKLYSTPTVHCLSCKWYQRSDITNVIFTQPTWSSCENQTLDDLWFSSILRLGNYYVTEQRTENIRLQKCKRYCLGQAVIMKLLKMKIICTEDTTYSWVLPPSPTMVCSTFILHKLAMFITQIIQWHRNFHQWHITLW